MFFCKRSSAGSFCPSALLQENSVPRSKGEKRSEKVARFAEKQYLCGRKAFQLNNHIADTE